MINYPTMRRSFLYPVVFLLITVFGACKKNDKTNDNLIESDNTALAEKFFTVSENAEPMVKAIAVNWNKQKGFKEQINKFVKKNGVPVWDKALLRIQNSSTGNFKSSAKTLSDSTTTGVVFIPLQDSVSKEITAYVSCMKHNDSLFTYRLYNKNELTHLPVKDKIGDTLAMAQRISLAYFAYFEKAINNKEGITWGGNNNKTIKNVTIVAGNRESKAKSNRTLSTYVCGWHTDYVTYAYTDAVLGTVIETFTIDYYVFCDWENLNGSAGGGGSWDPSNVGYPGYYHGGMPGDGGIYYTGGGSGGSTGWWSYGTGYNGIYIGGSWYDPSLYPSFSGPAENWYPSFEDLIIMQLTVQLSLTNEEAAVLQANKNMVLSMKSYLEDVAGDWNEKVAKLKEHVQFMKDDPAYLLFVQQYTLTGSQTKVWWENEQWLDNNFSFASNCFLGWCGLNQKEKEFIKDNFVAAFLIKINADVAKTETRQLFNIPIGIAMPPNDKSNAFLHAFWCAMNLHSVGEAKARAFADAHEWGTPIQLQMESGMDYYNNEVGFNIAKTQTSLFSYHVNQALLNGVLVYLTPINTSDPYFWGGKDPNGVTVPETHGIIPNSTVLRPTNQ